jgi:hypothetical protein
MGDVGDEEAALGPTTPLGKLLTSISATMDRANANAPRAMHNTNTVTTVNDAVNKAYLKRRLDQCPAITDTSASDPVKIIDWLRSQEGHVKDDITWHTALVSLAGTCDLSANSPIQLVIKAASIITPFNHSAWLDTCKAILLNASLPNIVQQMDAALESVQARMADEPVSMHFNRYNSVLSRTQWLRTTLDKETSDDWIRPCLDRWAGKLGNTHLTAATFRLGPGSTLHDFYSAVLQAERTLNSSTETVKRVTRFNNISEEPAEKSLADLKHTVKTGNRELQQGSRNLQSRLLALEDLLSTHPAHARRTKTAVAAPTAMPVVVATDAAPTTAAVATDEAPPRRVAVVTMLTATDADLITVINVGRVATTTHSANPGKAVICVSIAASRVTYLQTANHRAKSARAQSTRALHAPSASGVGRLSERRPKSPPRMRETIKAVDGQKRRHRARNLLGNSYTHTGRSA